MEFFQILFFFVFNFNIIFHKFSGDTDSIRMSYIPGLSRMLSTPLLASVDTGSASKTVKMLDEYGLSRDDMMESLGEFNLSSGNSNPITRLTSAAKTALTRAYNSSVHHSQALVSDVNIGKKGGKKGTGKKGKNTAAVEFDGDEILLNGGDDIDEDQDVVEDDEDLESIAKAFVVQGKKGKTSSCASASSNSNGRKTKQHRQK